MRVYIFIRLDFVASQTCQLAQNSQKIWTYSSWRSSKVDDFVRLSFSANSKVGLILHTCSFGDAATLRPKMSSFFQPLSVTNPVQYGCTIQITESPVSCEDSHFVNRNPSLRGFGPVCLYVRCKTDPTLFQWQRDLYFVLHSWMIRPRTSWWMDRRQHVMQPLIRKARVTIQTR